MTNLIVIGILVLLYGSIIWYLIMQKKAGRSLSCATCPAAHGNKKDKIIKDLRKLIHD